MGLTALSGSNTAAGTGDLFGAGRAKLQDVMNLLRTKPAFGHAGMALGYVLNNVASKDKANLTDVDKGAIKQAIIQMQALVGSRAVKPAQAQILNGAIWQLQGALT